jgi:hypothetical protein
VAKHRDALRGTQIQVALSLGVGKPAALAADEHGGAATGRRPTQDSFFDGREIIHSDVRTCRHLSAPAGTYPHLPAPVRTCRHLSAPS